MTCNCAIRSNPVSNRSHAKVSQLEKAVQKIEERQLKDNNNNRKNLKKIHTNTHEIACETNRITIKYVMDSNVSLYLRERKRCFDDAYNAYMMMRIFSVFRQ